MELSKAEMELIRQELLHSLVEQHALAERFRKLQGKHPDWYEPCRELRTCIINKLEAALGADVGIPNVGI